MLPKASFSSSSSISSLDISNIFRSPAATIRSSLKPVSRSTSTQQLLDENDNWTLWMKMKLEEHEYTVWYNILAAVFTWLLLGGFLVLPGTFASIQRSDTLNEMGTAGKTVVKAAQNAPLLWVAGTFCICGTLGLLYLWFLERHNSIFVTEHILFPTAKTSIVGFITTLVNIYTAKGGYWSVPSRVTGGVSGACVVISLSLYVFYAKEENEAKKKHNLKYPPQSYRK